MSVGSTIVEGGLRRRAIVFNEVLVFCRGLHIKRARLEAYR